MPAIHSYSLLGIWQLDLLNHCFHLNAPAAAAAASHYRSWSWQATPSAPWRACLARCQRWGSCSWAATGCAAWLAWPGLSPSWTSW
jgi:hypothetical protein